MKFVLEKRYDVDTSNLIIIGAKVPGRPIHDTKHAVTLLKQCHRIRKSEFYVMDKAYDSEDIHKLVRNEQGSIATILFKDKKPDLLQRINRLSDN